jgi:Protein of unknown function (DUF3040)
MMLTRWEQHQLRRTEAALLRSDPQLAAIIAMFGRLYRGEAMPARDHRPRPLGRLRRSAAWVLAALADTAHAECGIRAQAPDGRPEHADGGPRPDGQP